jgi:hypothetical protein
MEQNMDKRTDKKLMKNAIVLHQGLFANILEGRLEIFKQSEFYGKGCVSVASLSYDDMKKLKELSNQETDRLNKLFRKRHEPEIEYI